MSEENKNMPKVEEVRIEKLSNLSISAQKEVQEKLAGLPENFTFKGFAKVSYGYGSPLKVLYVDPIEGTSLNYFNSILNKIQ